MSVQVQGIQEPANLLAQLGFKSVDETDALRITLVDGRFIY